MSVDPLTFPVAVYPSEVAAEYYRRRGGRVHAPALRTDRIISWDTYKERYLSVKRSALPANDVVRRLFAARWCAAIEADSGNLLGSIVPPAFAATAGRFARSVSRLLPLLGDLDEDLRAGRLVIPEATASDYRALYRRYRRFLDEHGLFEPGFTDSPEGAAGAPATCIVYPRLIDDFGRYSGRLSEVESFDPPVSGRYRVTAFETSVEEIDRLADELSRLLVSGVDPDEIVVSAAGLESIGPLLVEAARVRSLPLDIRSGRPLSEHPEGALFTRIRDCKRSGFDLEMVKALLLDPRIPWRNRPLNNDLVAFGVRARIGRNGADDVWLDRLDLAGERRLSGYYRSLRNGARDLVDAADFVSLRVAALRFVNGFLDVARSSPERGRVLESVLATLALFENGESMTGGTPAGVRPVSVWLSYLTDRIYVPRNRASAIPVYPYRVTAGINPRFHYVVNVADSSTRVVHRSYPFLAQHLRAEGASAAAPAGDDVSADFLRAYSVSGERVDFSYSRRGPAGPMLTPAEFVRSDLESAEPPVEVGEGACAFVSEREYWATGRSLPTELFPVQRDGFLAATCSRSDDADRIAAAPAADFTGHPVPDESLRSRLAAPVRDENGTFSISPSSLDLFSSCPFRFLVQRILRIDDEPYTVDESDAMLEGQVLHELAGRLAAELHDGASGDGLVDRLIDELGDQAQQRFPQPYPLLRWERVERFRRALDALLERERLTADVVGVECDYEVPFGDMKLVGRIDRISRNDRGLAIVDYKRGRIPRKSDLVRVNEATSFQIPIYAILVEAHEGEISEALYYSLFDEKEAPVYREGDPKSWFTGEELGAFKEEAVRRARGMADSIARGEYRTPAGSGRCDGCPVRAICRRRYFVRRGAV